ncbi:hypothetical protein Lalb_Chr16g0386881 [Lupinus albus]|uniref:Uncharacterized protein n=1 Tax=Lupinus albus TaxID=3870 RepID=A0A6A4P6S4_LUPAL|nr:hypothetical protein Lalb_Chr16g0386881 [Lupinus albus]
MFSCSHPKVFQGLAMSTVSDSHMLPVHNLHCGICSTFSSSSFLAYKTKYFKVLCHPLSYFKF